MIAKTNLDKIKETAKLLLDFPVTIPKEFGGIFVQHPIFRDRVVSRQVPKTDQNPVGLEMLDIANKKDLEVAKEVYRKAFDKCESAMHVFLSINKAYSGIFFKLIKDYLDIEDYTNILETIWTSMEYPNADVNVTKKEWINYWKKVDLTKIYSYEDLKFLYNLPEEFYVYRGLMEGAKLEALSWTLRLDKAIWFAKRFDRHGKVYKAKCHKKDILAYLSCRNEEEIVVDWKKLKDIEEVSY